MAVYDLGDVVSLGITITNAAGAPENATAVTASVTSPDGVTVATAVTNSGAGLYDTSFVPTFAGRYLYKFIATGSNASAYMDEFSVRDSSSISIVSLDEVKQHLNFSTDNYGQDEELRRFVDAATDLSENYVGCVLGRKVITDELYDGNTDSIRLRNPRAISITSVVENSATIPAAGYALDYTGQRITRITTNSVTGPNYFGIFSPGINNIKISYVAGFINPPAAAKQGVLEVVRHLWQTQRGAANVITRNQTGDDFMPGSTFSLPRRCMELLDQMTLPGIA